MCHDIQAADWLAHSGNHFYGRQRSPGSEVLLATFVRTPAIPCGLRKNGEIPYGSTATRPTRRAVAGGLNRDARDHSP